MAHISLQNVNKIYNNNVKAVIDFNLNIDEGEFIVIVGPSGCGKTTILRMITGLENVTSGDIFVGQNKVNDLLPKNRNIAMVFQNYTLFPYMNVYENIAFPLKINKSSENLIKNKVISISKLLNIHHLLNRKPKELSGGERQRVALGRVVIREPQAFLFDEPLSSLDSNLREYMRKEIKKIHQIVGRTTIYVTHDQTEAMTLGDRIVVMKDGMIQQIGSPIDLYNNPKCSFVATFISKTNLISGVVDINNDRLLFITDNNTHNNVLIDINREDNQNLYNLLKPYVNQKTVITIRPEDIIINSVVSYNSCCQLSNKFIAICKSVENHGYQSLVIVSAKNISQDLTVRVPSEERIQVGYRLNLSVKLDKINVFKRS